MEKIIPEKQKEVIEFRKAHGKTKVGDVNVDMVITSLKSLDVLLVPF